MLVLLELNSDISIYNGYTTRASLIVVMMIYHVKARLTYCSRGGFILHP
jgi:hypothetical protein